MSDVIDGYYTAIELLLYSHYLNYHIIENGINCIYENRDWAMTSIYATLIN